MGNFPPQGPHGQYPHQPYAAPPPPNAPSMHGYFGAQTIAVPTSGKATLSLVLGILSYVACLGAFTGVPAVALGFSARREIADSQGTLTGKGVANVGIGIGLLSSIGTLAMIVAIVAGAVGKGKGHTTTPPYGFGYTTPTPAIPLTPPTIPAPLRVKRSFVGDVEIAELESGSFDVSVKQTVLRGKTKRGFVLIQTTGYVCPKACKEIRSVWSELMWTRKVGRPLTVLEVDVEQYREALEKYSIPTDVGPVFVRFSAAGELEDAISADEWDANTAANVIPVLQKFATGTFNKRRAKIPGFEPSLIPQSGI